MSLVAYGSSDESEEESELEIEPLQNVCGLHSNRPSSPSTKIEPSKPSQNSVLNSGVQFHVGLPRKEKEEYGRQSDKPLQSLFQNLPQPKQNSPRPMCESTDQDELESHTDIPVLAFLPVPQSRTNLFHLGSDKNTDLNKKVGSGPVKITLPSLSQFNDDEEDEPIKKKLKPSKKGSGLFAILPAPKNVRSRETQQPLIPHVLTKKVSQALPAPTNHMNKVGKQSLLEVDYESEDDEEKDFFSLNSVSKVHEEEIDLGISTDSSLMCSSRAPQISAIAHTDTTVPNITCSEKQPLFQSGTHFSMANTSLLPGSSRESPYSYQDETSSYNSAIQPTAQEPSISFASENLQLDAEAMQRLCGRRSKKNQEPVEIIDVNGTEIMPDPSEWLIKQLSEEQPKMRSHSHKRNDGPTTQQRRKHQITYLAFQAKENELDLKNQWSQNRMTRKQTQSKYGF